MNTKSIRSCLLLAGSLCLTAGLFSQAPAAPKLEFPDASPGSTLKQRAGLTDIEVSYSRPGLNGRKIFGGLVPFDAVWRTGANAATKITFSTPVKLGGTEVPAGSYALFSIPGSTEWTVILNKATDQWGSYKYDEKNDLVRVKAKPVALSTPVETFTIGFSDVTQKSVTLCLEWEKTLVPVQIELDTVGMLVPQIEAAMAADGKKPYFPAAMFYFQNNLDLKKAAAWMDAAAAEAPEAFWILYRKGLVLAKMGDKAGALAAAQQSLAIASKQTGEVKDEYTRLNNALISSLR